MASNIHSSLEQQLANNLLYGYWGPLETVHLDILATDAEIPEEQQGVIRKFIETHLPKDEQTTVDLQDQRIHELFDKSMLNMVKNRVLAAIVHREKQDPRKDDSKKSDPSAPSAKKLQPATWKEYFAQQIETAASAVQKTIKETPLLQTGVDTVHNKLSKIGFIPPPDQYATKDDLLRQSKMCGDWTVIETVKSQHRQQKEEIQLIFEKWKENPSLVLEIESVKKSVEELRYFLPLSPTAEPSDF